LLEECIGIGCRVDVSAEERGIDYSWAYGIGPDALSGVIDRDTADQLQQFTLDVQ
jgi:hypothetical protein